MSDEYIDLLAAVYKRAVVDDCITVRSKSRQRLKELGVPSGKAFDYINSNNEHIKDIVRKNICQEYPYWGESDVTKKMQYQHISELVEELVSNYEVV